MDMQRFQAQLDDYLLGAAGPADVAEMEQALRAEPRLRRLLVERCLLEVHLRKAFAGSDEVRPFVRRRFPVRLALGGLLAASLLLGVGGWLALRDDKPAPTQAAAPQNTVVTGKLRVDGELVGQVVPTAKWLEVADDAPAVLRLADGSSVELAPGSRARLQDRRENVRQVVDLGQGAGQFKVAPGGGIFRVDTSLGSVQVLGTEFTVKLEARRGEKRRGRTVMSVAVTTGSVRVEAEGKVSVLKAGDVRVFGREKREDDD